MRMSSMRSDETVVSNTSPLLNLALVDRLDLLETQFETIHVPREVWDELTAGEAGVPELRTLSDHGTLREVSIARDA